ncbi:AT-rich interactive domain-containing protein 4B isoform X1, partial [Silurus meridionalis]
QTLEEPAYLTVGTDVSAKYRGAFCEAKIKTAKKLVKAKVTFKPDSSTAEVHDEHIRGNLKVGAVVEVKNQDGIYQEATITKLTDASLYTVVFDDGDEKTLRRSSLCLKGARHFAESETLDRLPLTNPEHFGTPVIGTKGNRGRRSNAIQEEESSSSSSEEEDGDPQQSEELYGKVVVVEGVSTEDKMKTFWFPALVISPDCHEDVMMKKDSVFVRSFKDGKFYMILRKDIKELDSEMDPKAEASLKPVMSAAWNFQCSGTVPSSWRTEVKYESSSSEENEEEEEEVQEEGGTSEEEEEEVEPFPEERDNFLQQLYKFMEDRGTPINKRPVLGYRNLNLFKLYRLVHKLGGFNSIESGSVWKQVYQDLGIPVLNSAAGYNVKCAYRKYLYGFEDYCTSTGITFHFDLPFKATESSHTDSSIEGPAERTNHVHPRPDPEISLSMKKIVKEGKSEEAELFRNKVNSRSPKDEDMMYSDEDSSTDKELKLKVEESSPAEDSCTENVKVEPCKDQNRDLLRDDSSQEWEEGEEFECYPPGMKVQVRYGRGRNQKTYEATVKESDLEGGEVLYLVHYCGWNVRYDEWIKADKIIRPANKNVPKIKHRKKIKNKIEQERDRIGSLNDREDYSPIDIQNNQSSSLGSGNGVFPKMEEFKDASGQKSPVKSSNVSELQAPVCSTDYCNHEQDEEGDHINGPPAGKLSPLRRAFPEILQTALQWESEPPNEGDKASVKTSTPDAQYSPEDNKQLVTEGEASNTRRRKTEGTTDTRIHKIQRKLKTRGSKLSDWLSESSLKKLEQRNTKPQDESMQSSSSSEEESDSLMESQAKEELLMHHKGKSVPSTKYMSLNDKSKGGRSSTFWEIPDKQAKITSGMDDRTPGCRSKGQKDVWSSIQAQWPKKTLKELFSDSDTEAANSPPQVTPCLSELEPKQKNETHEELQEGQEKNQEYPSSGSNSILNTPPTTPESAEVLCQRHLSSPPPQSSVLVSCSPATSSSAGLLIEECVDGRNDCDTSMVEMDIVSCEFHMLPQEDQSGSPSKIFEANLSSNSSCSLSLSSSSQQEIEQKSKESSCNQKRHRDSQEGGALKKHKPSHKTLTLNTKKNHKSNSSDSEDQCLSEMAAKALISKCSTQDTKAIIPPKGSARTSLSHKYHKHTDSEHLYPKEQQSSRGSRTYKWSFQMSDLEKMTSLEKIAFLQEKLQDIRNHYLLLKSEVASIDRRRKRIKKKEQESAAVLYSSSSSPSSSSLTAAVMLTLAEPTVSGSSQNSGVSLECR